MHLPAISSTRLPVLLSLFLAPMTSSGAESIAPDAFSTPAATLERFIASQQDAHGWSSETIEIQASLPKLKKSGRLLAIRTLFPAGQPDYKVLETDGDPTVKQQVIVRYISADEKTNDIPAASVALVPTNYKIRYAGALRVNNRPVYAFRVVPHKKRVGLINGVIWLDAETSVAIRESGYLAKSPSIFIKRINLTRENELRNGTVESRTTYVSVETRLVGRAQLVIAEHPSSDAVTTPGVKVVAGQ